MRALIQRTKNASVKVDGKTVGEIKSGICVLLGVEENDEAEDIDWLVQKLIHLRIFSDERGKMNLSVRDIGGKILVISQFTLYGNVKKGARPSFARAAPPEKAILLYEKFTDTIRKENIEVETGKFGAMMDVSLINHGPVTLMLDSKNKAY